MENRLPNRATKCLCHRGRCVERCELRWMNQELDLEQVLEGLWQHNKRKICDGKYNEATI